MNFVAGNDIIKSRAQMASNAYGMNGSPSVRVIIQQCLSAELQVQPPSDGVEAQSVEVSEYKGVNIAYA